MSRTTMSNMDQPDVANSAEAPDGARPYPFSPAEQLALFPSLGGNAAPLPEDVPAWLWPTGANAAAAAGRASRPLTLDAFRAALDSAANPMGSMLALEMVLHKNFGSKPWIGALVEACSQALYVFLWVLGPGTFGIRNLAAGQVVFVLHKLGWDLLYVVGLFAPPTERARRAAAADRRKAARDDDPEHMGPIRSPESLDHLDAQGYSGLVRYLQLLEGDMKSSIAAGRRPDSSRLLDDNATEKLCSCPDCTGPFVKQSRLSMLAFLIVHMCLTNFTLIVATFWSAAVTLGPFVWTSTVATALLVPVMVLLFVATEINTYFPGGPPNPSVYALELRLRHRAVAICLRNLVDRLTCAADHPTDGDTNINDANLASCIPKEPYIGLHGQLLADWRSSLDSNAPLRLLGVGALCTHSVAAVVSIAVGNCLPALLIGDFAITLHVMIYLALSYAYKNLQSRHATAQYRACAQELSVLAGRLPASRALLRHTILSHRDLLLSFTDLDAFKAGFFGVPMTFATLRGIVVAGFSILVGLWTVLRALGVGVTMDLACRLTA